MLKQPPAVDDMGMMAKMQAFSLYVERTWIAGLFSPKLWGHFDNTEPRTTNQTKGWHNSLNYSLGMPHPSLQNFLHWLQKCQFQVQCREIQLEAGRPSKPESPVYHELGEKITNAKHRFSHRTGNMFF